MRSIWALIGWIAVLQLNARNDITGDVGTVTLKVSTPKNGKSFSIATPFFILSKTNWINRLGFDPQKPPERLGGLKDFPVSYRGSPCTVDVYPDPQDGQVRALLIKLYGFTVSSDSKEPDIGIRWDIVDASGRSAGSPAFKLLEKPYRPADSQIEYLFDMQFPKLSAGSYWLKVQATDKISGAAAAEWVPVQVN